MRHGNIERGAEALERAVGRAEAGATPERLIPNADVLDVLAYARALEEALIVTLRGGEQEI